MTAYYNEIDPFAAAWLRELIKAGEIAPGDVDERSIEDVRPDDLRGYTQCHFFAGIGVWSRALRMAGWADSRPVWTGSCPCQPFSVSGRKGGFADERHLWPAFYHLIREYREIGELPVILGEQVAGKAAEPWFDLVQADLEALGYAFGCVPFPSAGVGAPHIRDRAYWAGVAGGEGLEGLGSGHQATERQRQGPIRPAAPAGESVWMADAHRLSGKEGCSDDGRRDEGDHAVQGARSGSDVHGGGLANTIGVGVRGEGPGAVGAEATGVQGADGQRERLRADDRPGSAAVDEPRPAGPTNGFWADADWLFCRDGKWRPVIPSPVEMVDGVTTDLVRVCDPRGGMFFPLEEKAPARVGRLRGYGNAINAEAARVFIESVKEILP